MPQVRERPDLRVVGRSIESVMTQWLRIGDAIADPRVDDARAAVDFAAAADRRRALRARRRDAGSCPAPIVHVAIDVGGRRILDRDARRHQLRVLVSRTIRLTAASSMRLLMPRISSAIRRP